MPNATLLAAIVVAMSTLPVPSNDTVPVTSPLNAMFLAAVSLVALNTFLALSVVLSALSKPT